LYCGLEKTVCKNVLCNLVFHSESKATARAFESKKLKRILETRRENIVIKWVNRLVDWGSLYILLFT